MKLVAVDFDGTIVENDFPGIGRPIDKVVNRIKKGIERGDRFILWTCREDDALEEAIAFCNSLGIEFVAVNENDPQRHIVGFAQHKIYADEYWDDRGVNPIEF
jgi:hydroxymethylpyrimidine pyrophosphatase-like HAD family hydrolase